MTRIGNWYRDNCLTIHPDKSNFILFGPPKDRVDLDLYIMGTKLEQVGERYETKAIKFLGIMIDSNLKWDSHVSYISNKLKSAIYQLNKCKRLIPLKVRLLLYNGLVKSHLQYGIEIWGTAKSSVLKKLFLLQKRAVRVTNLQHIGTHTNLTFLKLGILQLKDLYELAAIRLVEKAIRCEAPVTIKVMFNLFDSQHCTRASQLPHLSKVFPTNNGKILTCLADSWNKRPFNLTNTPTNLYIKSIKYFLIQNYNTFCSKDGCFSCIAASPFNAGLKTQSVP